MREWITSLIEMEFLRFSINLKKSPRRSFTQSISIYLVFLEFLFKISFILGFLNWKEFLSLMEIIKAKTIREKIDLFIKIADDDGNGQLSKQEIFDLCKICLGKMVKSDNEDTEFLENISEYFTKLIFAAVEVDIESEIPLEKIKQTILSGNAESDLLCMFCGADI